LSTKSAWIGMKSCGSGCEVWTAVWIWTWTDFGLGQLWYYEQKNKTKEDNN